MTKICETTLFKSSETFLTLSGTLLSEDDMDALQKVLQNAKIKLASAKLTLEKAKQLLIEKGLDEIAANLRAKLDKGMLQ